MNIAELLAQEPELAERARRIRSDPDTLFPVLSAKFKLTWRCNLRCRMCSLWKRPPRDADASLDLPPGAVREILTYLHERGLRKVHFSGGEILLLDTFPDTLRFARGLGLQVNLTTNGTLLDKETARLLVAERVHGVAVSIDAARERDHDAIRGVKGAWKQTWRGIERLLDQRHRKGRRAHPRLAINTVVTRENIDSLDALYQMLGERGVDHWRLLPVDTEEKRLRPSAAQWEALAARWESWRPLLERLPIDWSSARSAARAVKGKYAGVFYGERICFAPWFHLFVTPEGRLYPCCMTKGELRPYGNILDQPLSDILTGEHRREVRCSMASGHPFDVCDRCDDFLEENAAFNDLYSKKEIQK